MLLINAVIDGINDILLNFNGGFLFIAITVIKMAQKKRRVFWGMT